MRRSFVLSCKRANGPLLAIYLNMVADERHDAEPDGNPNLFFVEMWFTDDFEVSGFILQDFSYC